jgi:hypothetical protein
MPKTSHKLMIIKRTAQLRQNLKIDTQEIRIKTLNNLQELFTLATDLAKGNPKTQTTNGETKKVTLKQRQIWARIAAYIAQIINSVAHGFDEKQIDQDLEKLEKLINEATTKNKTKKTPTKTS